MKALRFIEKLLTIFAVFGMIMKFTGIAGGGMFIVFSLSILGIIYFFGSWFFFKEEQVKWKSTRFSFLAGAGFSLACVGICFKLMHWLGAEQQLLTGIILTTIVTAYSISQRNKNADDEIKNKYYGSIIDRGMIIVLVSSILFSIPSSSMIRFEYRKDPKLAELMVNFLNDPENKEKWEALQTYRMDQLMNDGHPATIKPK